MPVPEGKAKDISIEIQGLYPFLNHKVIRVFPYKQMKKLVAGEKNTPTTYHIYEIILKN